MSLKSWFTNLRSNTWRSSTRRRGLRVSNPVLAGELLEEKVLLSLVTGTVFEDLHTNGVPDSDERRIEALSVSLWEVGPDQQFGTVDDQFSNTTQTTSTGVYSLSVESPGTYIVQLGEQSGAYRFIADTLKSPTLTTVTVSSSGISEPFVAGENANDIQIDGPLAHVGSDQARARQLQRTWSFQRTQVNYYFDAYGRREKWLKSGNEVSAEWFFITPEGDLYRWNRVNGQAAGEFIAAVGEDVYSTPTLLHHALAVIEPYSERPVDLAWELDSELHFDAASTWYETYGNLNVRWVAGDRNQYGSRWYFLKKDGSLFAWDGTARTASGTFLGLLSPEYYDNPVLLTNAVRPFSNGDVRSLYREAFGIYDVAPVPATVINAAGKWFKGSPNQFGNTLYFVNAAGGFVAWNGTTGESGRSLGQLPKSVYATPGTFAAAPFPVDTSSVDSAAYDLDRLYRLVARRWYFLNWSGQNEKWIEGTRADGKSQWYFILPNGDFHEAHSWNNVTRSVTSTRLLTLSPEYFHLPGLLHNAIRPIPQPLSQSGVLQLSEGNPFASVASVDIELGVSAGTRTFSFDIRSFIDRTDISTTLEDTLAVYLTQPGDRSQTVLDRGTPGTSLFTLSGGHADFVPGTVRFDGSVVSLDLSSFAAPATAQLVFQLLNTDRDLGTRFLIKPLSNVVDPDGVQPATFSRQSSIAGIGVALDTTAFVPTTQVQLNLENLRYLPNDGVFRAEMSLTNTGDPLARSVAVAFPGLPAGVTLKGFSGTTAAGVPYINVTNANPSGGLDRGGQSDRILVEFDNPLNMRFPLQPVVLTPGENHAPVWTPVGPLSVSPGGTLVIDLKATDADGDSVTYSLAAPARMPTTVLSANGHIEFRPELDQLGSYTFDVIADDGIFKTRQSVTLDVVSDNDPTTRISGIVRNTLDQPLAGVPIEIAGFSAVTAADGSFTITLPTMKVPTEEFNITVPTGDVFLDPFNTGDQQIRFRRSRHDVTTGDSISNPRQHPNLVSSFIDASTVYGSDATRASALRMFADGKLKTSSGNLLPHNDTATFADGPLENDNEGRVNPAFLFAAGDVRTNENVALIAIHTVLLREHNRLADAIKAADPLLSDEQIYQQARRMVGAIIQHITYNEYLPLLIGTNSIPVYSGYDESVDPRESELFATAAFRIGHTQLASEIKRLAADGSSLPGGSLQLKDAFFTPAPIQNDGIEPFLRGMVATPMQEVDAHIIDDVRNFLFGPPGSGGMDLASMNIQRSRDVGLPSYNQARIDFGLTAVTSFADITSDSATQTALESIYGSVDKIDVWVGGISENHVAGAQVGPLFQSVLRDQFLRSRSGDRFYYENGQFTAGEMAAIRATTVATLIERNAPGVDLPDNAFTTGTQSDGPGLGGTSASGPAGEFRSLDGTGNNLATPALGATGGNVIRNFTNGYADGISEPAGADRPGPREISNAVIAQSGSLPSSSGATSLLVFWGQILDHDLGLTPGGVTDSLRILGNQRPNPSGNEAYPFVAERMDLMLGHPTYPGVNNVISRPIYLPVLDVAGGTTITPTSNATVSQEINPGESVNVFVAASTLEDRQGNDFNGVLSITEVPRELTPAALPSNLLPDLVVTIQPADMVFTTPAPITFPNRSGLAPGTLMDLWSINPITGQFDDVGDMQVSPDGSVIETISGGIRNSSWHFPAPQPPDPVDPDDLDQNKDDNCKGQGSGSCSCNNAEAVANVGSQVELHSGSYREWHDTVPYTSLGEIRSVSLHYNSERANPQKSVYFGFNGTGNSIGQFLAANVTVSKGSMQFVPNGNLALLPGVGTVVDSAWKITSTSAVAGVPLNFDSLPTGLYEVSIATGIVRNGSAGVSGTLVNQKRTITVVNSRNGVFGNGWGISGLLQAVENLDGSVLLVDGEGGQILFKVVGNNLISPPGDFSVLRRTASGFERQLKDQTVQVFGSDGYIQSQTDRVGRTTSYQYDGMQRLTAIVDPVGLSTRFDYDGQYVSHITDPMNLVTTLTHDSHGNLLSIADPDGSKRQFEYDSQFQLVKEIDKRGFTELISYDAFGHVTATRLADASVRSIYTPTSPFLGVGLPVTTMDQIPGAQPRQPAIATIVTPNGNVVSVTLDSLGQSKSSVDSSGSLDSLVRNDKNLLVSTTDGRGSIVSYEYDSNGNLINQLETADRAPSAGIAFSNAPIRTGSSPRDLTIADVVGDGNRDLIVANYSENTVSVKEGGGNGVFADRFTLNVGNGPSAIALADLNGDSDQDIITANKDSGTISVVLSDGTGAFSAALSFTTGDNSDAPISLALSDVNRDNLLDVVVANSTTNTISVMLNGGGGIFLSPQKTTLEGSPRSVQATDINNDGLPDLVYAIDGSMQIYVKLGLGNAAFGSTRTFTLGNVVSSFAIGDLDNDSNKDLVVTSSAGSKATALFGTGTGDFASPVEMTANGPLSSVKITPANQNGFPNIIAITNGTNSVEVFQGLGSRQFGAALAYRSAVRPSVAYIDNAIAVSDVNFDGAIDVAVASKGSNEVSVLLGRQDGSLTHPVMAATDLPYSMSLGDLNGDGIPDMVSTEGNRAFVVYLGTGDGRFNRNGTYQAGQSNIGVPLLVDINADQKLDALVPGFDSQEVNVLLGDGQGGFGLATSFAAGSGTVAVAAADFDGDGKLDMVAANYYANTVSVFKGLGNGSFETARTLSGPGQPNHVTVADVNLDGNPDIITANWAGNASVLLGDGTGGFAAVQDFQAGGLPHQVAVGDVNGDSKPDLVVVNNSTQNVSVLIGDGTGNFAAPRNFSTTGTGHAVKLADFDGDHALDIITANGATNTFTIFKGDGTGNFVPQDVLNPGTKALFFDLADINLDGSLDIVAANVDSFDFSVITGISKSGSATYSRKYTYDSTFNQITSITDQRGNKTEYVLDPANGLVRSILEADGTTESMTYTINGLQETITDAKGIVTSLSYDPRGNLVRRERSGTVELWENDLAGYLTAYVDQNGHRTEYTRDAMHRVTSMKDANGGITSYVYDTAGNVQSVTDPLSRITKFKYDSQNRRIEEIDPLNNSATMKYDAEGNVVTVTDELGHSMRNRYDARNRLVETTDPDGGKTRFRYDAADNLISITDPVGNKTLNFYDSRNLLVSEVDPLGFKTSYTYDPVGNLSSKTDRNGRITQYAYDSRNRNVREKWTNGGNSIHVQYDANGNVVLIADAFSSLAYAYDDLDRVTSVDNLGTPDAAHVILSYGYDAAGNVVSVVDSINGAAGATTSMTYDALNRVAQITQTGAGVAEKRVNYGFNALSQVVSIGRFSDLAGTQVVANTAYSFDNMNRLSLIGHTNFGGTTLASFGYHYDAASRIQQIVEADQTIDYRYDMRDQLVSANYGDAARTDEAFKFDANGNRVESNAHGTAYRTGPGNRLTTDGVYNYAYDNEGNLTKRTEIASGSTREFQWDHRNRLTMLSDKNASGVLQQVVRYSYDSLGRRISKQVDTTQLDTVDAAIEQYVFDGEDVILDFVDSDGSGPAASQQTTRYLRGPGIDNLLAIESASGTNWVLQDHLGSTRALVSSAGVLVQSIDYDSFGKAIVAGSPSTRYLYTGRELDAESGLFYFRARYYDSSTGRFTNEDPIGFDGGSWNTQIYVDNSPIAWNDATGNFAAAVIPAIGYGYRLYRLYQAAQAVRPFIPNPDIFPKEEDSDAGDRSGTGGSTGGSCSPGDPEGDGNKPKRTTNPKHHPNSRSPEPKDVQDLYDNSIGDTNGNRWAKDGNGDIHRFSKPSNGESHWNGSTAGPRPISRNNIPNDVQRLLK